jgi:hypothetical protein
MEINTDINDRWEKDVPHHPMSIELYKILAHIDFVHGGDAFGWKSGGDGDNGEHLMYELDIYFESLDHAAKIHVNLADQIKWIFQSIRNSRKDVEVKIV